MLLNILHSAHELVTFNGFCFTCSRVYFKDLSANNLCRNMFLTVDLKKIIRGDLEKMFIENNTFLFDFDVCMTCSNLKSFFSFYRNNVMDLFE